MGETLTLKFFNDPAANLSDAIDVIINPTFFRDKDHLPTFPEDALINIGVDGVFPAVPYSLINVFTTPLGPGHTFDFVYVNEQFYISSLTVPLPAPLILFLSALAGLALLGRRQRRKVAA